MFNSRISSIWTEKMNKNGLRLMAMSAALKDVELMEKLKAKITVPKQTRARG